MKIKDLVHQALHDIQLRYNYRMEPREDKYHIAFHIIHYTDRAIVGSKAFNILANKIEHDHHPTKCLYSKSLVVSYIDQKINIALITKRFSQFHQAFVNSTIENRRLDIYDPASFDRLESVIRTLNLDEQMENAKLQSTILDLQADFDDLCFETHCQDNVNEAVDFADSIKRTIGMFDECVQKLALFKLAITLLEDISKTSECRR